MKPEAPKSMQRRITAGSSLAETTTIGTLGYCARRYIKPGKAAHARHGQIEQDEIDVAAAFEQLGDVVEGAGLRDIDLLEQPGDRLAQGAAKQRMIVGDDQTIACRFGHSFHLPVDGILGQKPWPSPHSIAQLRFLTAAGPEGASAFLRSSGDFGTIRMPNRRTTCPSSSGVRVSNRAEEERPRGSA